MSASEASDVPKARKAFIPLECAFPLRVCGCASGMGLVQLTALLATSRCNPDLMTTLVHKLGLSKQLAFVDVYSLSDPDLLAFVPRPALALLLVFPVSPSYEQFRINEDASLPDYDKKGDGEDPMWFKQTIRNACGMMGVLHAVSNGSARSMIRLCPLDFPLRGPACLCPTLFTT
jgi:hypothetical protein